MSAVLLSIRPQYCELIAIGEKTIEVRKTKPKIPTPFKCYIYETKAKTDIPTFVDEDGHYIYEGRGQVIGEFVCDEIYEFKADDDYAYGIYDIDDDLVIRTCLVNGELWDYGKGKTLHGWHISNLTIYDEPKELSEFAKPYDAKHCVLPTKPTCNNCDRCYIKRPPQSWCYVEELT